MLKSYLPGINIFIFPKRHYENVFYGKIFNELHDCTEKQPHVILHPNASEPLFVKINGTIANKHNHLLRI